MSAVFEWNEDGGASTGSPAKGTTRTTAVTQANFKNIDDVATAYTSAPISAGTNSYPKFQFGKFSGSWNTLSSCKWSPHTAGTLATDCTLVGKVTSTYATPATTALSGTTDFSSIVAVGSGASVNFHGTGPEGASPTSTASGGGTYYTQFLVSQLQVGVSTPPGDIATITHSLQYIES